MVAEKLSAEKSAETDNNLTISTKLSTDQLICKSPQTSSPEGSLKSLRNEIIPIKDEKKVIIKHTKPYTLYFGIFQILFGLLMAIFGVLVLMNEASLSQIGGGLWGGLLATTTGIIGVLSAARDCCPLKSSPHRIALTAFLALSLVSLAVSNLVLVLSAIGLARDASKSDEEYSDSDKQPNSEEEEENVSIRYPALLTNTLLLLICACECVVAAFSAYHTARALCSCFKSPDEDDCHECARESSLYGINTGKDILVSNWLGKQHVSGHIPRAGVQQVYVVKSRKMMPQLAVAPIYSMPTPPASLLSAPMMGYPLIPAPLGATPPPILHAHHPHGIPEKIHKKRRQQYPSDRQLQPPIKTQERQKKQKKSREKEKTITEEEVAKTYTGLDRIIAEEFIQICDSTRNTNTSCSESTGTSTSSSNESTSQDYVGERL